jgi:hypothetical protein
VYERKRGISEWLVRKIEEIHARTRNKMKVGEKEGDWFETTKRVRQGSPHSPPLFTIYVVEMLLLLLLLISCSTGKSQLKSMYVKESTSLGECGV